MFDQRRRPINVKSPETMNRIHQHYITQYQLEQWKQDPLHALAKEEVKMKSMIPNSQNIHRHNEIIWQRFLKSQWDDLTSQSHNMDIKD